MNKREFHRLLLASASAIALPGRSFAQPAKGTMAELSQYTGADRMQKLVDGAKKEGTLSMYTSAQGSDMGPLVAAFEKKYGVKTDMWRAGSENVLQRAVTEARANRFTVDVVETNGPELESLSREKIFQAVKSPQLANIMPQALRPHGQWVGTRLNVFVQAYNTKAVKKEELPKSWDDLLKPIWKGRLGIEQEDQDWLAGMASELGEARAIKLFKDVVATNGMSVRKGHTLLTQLVASGEVPFALTVYNYKVEQLRQKGAPIDWLAVGKAVARPNGIGVARQAPHPHAALLFYDFELSEEGQKILAGRDFVPTNTKVDSAIAKQPLQFVDAAMMLDAGQKWVDLYQQIFAIKAR
jgi:iron(III) transport system substrate-binding protein